MKQNLNKELSSEEFNEYYYIKDELVDFCHKEGLKTSGKKIDLEKRISNYLDTTSLNNTNHKRESSVLSNVSLDSNNRENLNETNDLRRFFNNKLDSQSRIKLDFHKWLRKNPERRHEAVRVYHEIQKVLRKKLTSVEKQYQFNKYINAFFNNNPDGTFEDAVHCWKYKKSLNESRTYDDSDLVALSMT